MKKIVLLTAAVVSLASVAFAATPIRNSKHDLSAASSESKFANTGSTQICIFCHTPHNAQPAVPLWNRSNPANNIGQYYNTSPTLSSAASGFGGATFPTTFRSDSVSLLCLSCHDGSVALGAYQNKAGVTNDTTTVMTGSAAIGAGGDLSNDHPIGFSYAAAQSGEARLHPLAQANQSLGYNAFFGTGGVFIECASCHKVHDNTYSPFLRIDNTGSALCLACHNK